MTHFLDHTSRHLPDELVEKLEPVEWEARPGKVRLECGHTVWVKPGDTLWVYDDDDDEGSLMIFAVDPGTIH